MTIGCVEPNPLTLVHASSPLFSDSLAMALSQHGVRARAVSAVELVNGPQRERTDAVLLDVEARAASPSRVAERHPKSRLVAVVPSGARVTTDVLRAGFHGFVSAQMSAGEIADAIRSVLRGQTVFPPECLADLVAQVTESRAARHRAKRLTPREVEVLRMLATGICTSAMAEGLYISPATLRTHVQNVLSKLGAHSRLEAVASAARIGLLVADEPPEPRA